MRGLAYRLHVLFIVVIICVIKSEAATVEGSGEEEYVDDLISIGGNEQGSGTEDTEPNFRCTSNQLYCWCIYLDGTEIPNTKVYAKKPSCSVFISSNVVHTSTTAGVPTRSTTTKKPADLPSSNDDIEFVDEKPKEEVINPVKAVVLTNIDIGIPSPKNTTLLSNASTETTMNNKIPTVKVTTPESPVEELEEETNKIGESRRLENVNKEEINQLHISHPGIIGALAAGGAVGLICAVLLVLFIIYRMKKRDEGSYPLDDGKPLRNYDYAKAPTREFFA